MNANELADGLEDATNKLIGKEHELGGRAIIFYTEAATMLRQQQAEIENLKNANRFIQNFAEEQHQRAVALEMRELTDEEILEIASPMFEDARYPSTALDFARAILRKAQE